MTMRLPMIAAVVALGLGVAAQAKPLPAPPAWPELGVETRIPFPDRTIRDFEADTDEGIWLQDNRRRWYYGRFIGNCPGLQFAQVIAFDTRGSAEFDKHSVILIEREKCFLSSLVTSDRPPPRGQRTKPAPAGGNETPKP